MSDLIRPNASLDYSAQDLLLPPATLAGGIRERLEWVPENVLFGSDAYLYSDQLGWEASGWIAARMGRQALELARMVLRENARRLYGL